MWHMLKENKNSCAIMTHYLMNLVCYFNILLLLHDNIAYVSFGCLE